MATKPKGKGMVTVSLYISKELLTALTKRADEERRSLSQVAAFIIEKEFTAAPKEV
jgi:hypothetical protein